MHALSRRASFWVAAAVVAIALWTSAAPTVSYPLYASEWNLTPAVTTAVFAVYPLVLVVVLVVFGNLSDYIGRRRAILYGLAASLAGVLLFALAPNVGWIFAGRVLMGIGVGLSMSPATAAMVEFSARGQEKRASSITTASTAAGLALATLVGGVLIEYGPIPTQLNFWVLSVVVAGVAVFAWFLPRRSATDAAGRWRPPPLAVPHGLRGSFAIAAAAVSGAFALGALILSLGVDIAQALIGSDNALVNGAVISLNAVVIGASALVVRRWRSDVIVVAGGVATLLGVGLLLLASMEHSLLLFIAAGVVTGVGYSSLFSGGLGLINATAPSHHRAGTISSVYLVAYFLQGAIALFLGALATASGLQLALEIGVVIVAVLSLAAAALAVTVGRARVLVAA
ncbi:MFS family permease [Mycetocola sp. CAN_C7]|uniref:MFS transporter n=1 Tax=Mycetocola sp. CAN_C7 TaxID=2787724 RepID=UPI0018CAE9E5